MAKRQRSESSDVSFRVVGHDEASRLLAESRAGRGGRISKYQGILDAFRTLGEGKAIHARLSRAEVQGIRQYLTKQLGDTVKVVSSAVKEEPGMFHVLVVRADG